MIYFLGILINGFAGFLLIRWLTGARLHLILHILLALALGLGMAGTSTFYMHILLNQSNHWLPIGLVVLIIIILYRQSKDVLRSFTAFRMTKAIALSLLALAILAIPLSMTAHYFPLGGWDAWSCWNLKAKFIFLSSDNWKDILAPSFWRSNTNYPLLWPLINVWFWDLGGRFDQAIPMLNSILIALLTAGILIFGLLELTGLVWPSIALAVIITALPFGVTLYISQYSDSLVGLFLLSAFMSLLLAEKYKLPKLKILSMIFLGLMTFTKNEGLMLGGISALLILWHERSHKKELKNLIISFSLAALPTIIFTLFIAPKNEAFINGLTSADKHSTWERLSVILAYPWYEMISGKWNGLWILILGGILLAGKKLWQSSLGIIALSIILYLGVVLAYYEVNTFFEIQWWLSTTLSRILFALVPTLVLWIGLGLTPANHPTKR